jgi:hypothetical protein
VVAFGEGYAYKTIGWMEGLATPSISTTYFLDLLLLVVRKQVSGRQSLLTATVETRKLFLL